MLAYMSKQSPAARTKECSDCREPKPLSSFGRNCQAKSGLHYYCKACAAKRQRQWATTHPDKVRAMRQNYQSRIRAANVGRDPYE